MALDRQDVEIIVPVILPLHNQLGLVHFVIHVVRFVDSSMPIQTQVRVVTETRTRPMTRWKRASRFISAKKDLSILDLHHMYPLMSCKINLRRIGSTAPGALTKHVAPQKRTSCINS